MDGAEGRPRVRRSSSRSVPLGSPQPQALFHADDFVEASDDEESHGVAATLAAFCCPCPCSKTGVRGLSKVYTYERLFDAQEWSQFVHTDSSTAGFVLDFHAGRKLDFALGPSLSALHFRPWLQMPRIYDFLPGPHTVTVGVCSCAHGGLFLNRYRHFT